MLITREREKERQTDKNDILLFNFVINSDQKLNSGDGISVHFRRGRKMDPIFLFFFSFPSYFI